MTTKPSHKTIFYTNRTEENRKTVRTYKLLFLKPIVGTNAQYTTVACYAQ